MSRLTAGDPLIDVVAEPVVRPFLAVRVDTPDPVYVFTGQGRMTFADADGVDREWIGAGEIASIDTIGEASDGTATGFKATLFKIPGDFQFSDGTWMGDYLASQAKPGVKVDVGLGAFDVTYQALEGFAWLNRYKLDDYKITDGGSSLAVQISGENRSIDQKRPAVKRFTDEWQQRKYPGDIVFQYVPQMAEVQILWAKAEQSGTIGGGVGSGGSFGGGGGRDMTYVNMF